jgi:hypothetical protein
MKFLKEHMELIYLSGSHAWPKHGTLLEWKIETQLIASSHTKNLDMNQNKLHTQSCIIDHRGYQSSQNHKKLGAARFTACRATYASPMFTSYCMWEVLSIYRLQSCHLGHCSGLLLPLQRRVEQQHQN